MNQPATPALPPKRFASVRDLVKSTAANQEQVHDFDRFLADTVLVRALLRARAEAGLTQADVAERMGHTQSAVSKLEKSSDGQLTIREIAGYLAATGGRIGIGIGKPTTRVERIKGLAIGLKRELEALAQVSSTSDDDALRQSIKTFFGEAWFNLFLILCDTTAKLPQGANPEDTSPVKLLGGELSDQLTNSALTTAAAG